MTESKSGSASVRTFLSILENPLLRSVIRFSAKKCGVCGRSYIGVALDEYVGNRNHHFSIAHFIFSRVISLAINIGSKTFGIDPKQTREALKVPYFKKGLANVLEGIGKYGVTKPQRLAAPFLVVWNYTNACNLRCKHCYQSAEKPTPDELTTEERIEIIDQLD